MLSVSKYTMLLSTKNVILDLSILLTSSFRDPLAI
nr:MAG TPA: hypothetical protein [Bacteriophage sp.]